LSKHVPQMIRDETIIVDNLTSNGDFETFVGDTFTNWSTSGSPTVSQETSIIKHGDGSAKVVASGAAGQMTQSMTVNFNQATNRQVTFEAWVYATAADTARIRILWGSSSYESHSYHDGGRVAVAVHLHQYPQHRNRGDCGPRGSRWVYRLLR